MRNMDPQVHVGCLETGLCKQEQWARPERSRGDRLQLSRENEDRESELEEQVGLISYILVYTDGISGVCDPKRDNERCSNVRTVPTQNPLSPSYIPCTGTRANEQHLLDLNL
jgi:hypothetical protein